MDYQSTRVDRVVTPRSKYAVEISAFYPIPLTTVRHEFAPEVGAVPPIDMLHWLVEPESHSNDLLAQWMDVLFSVSKEITVLPSAQ